MTMQHLLTILVLACTAIVSAHFQLQFPTPRGVFNEDNEPKFCDGYNTVASNRTLFPLSGGIFSLNSEHPTWTAAVLLSTDESPTSFNSFKQVKPFFQLHGEGIFCLPLDFSANSNSSNLQNGQNVTVQIIFDGGDGSLFQCADLIVSSDANLASTPCSNATGSSSSVAGSATSVGTTSPSVTSPSSNSPSLKPSNAGPPTNELTLGSLGALLGMLGIVTALC